MNDSLRGIKTFLAFSSIRIPFLHYHFIMNIVSRYGLPRVSLELGVWNCKKSMVVAYRIVGLGQECSCKCLGDIETEICSVL